MNVLIVDDEAPARDRLRDLLGDIDGVRVCADLASGEAAIDYCQQNSHGVDLVLLDIRMPGCGGMATAETLRKQGRAPQIIFTTAYGDHAVEAFNLQAADYLLKPVRAERLRTALERAGALRAMEPSEARYVTSQQQGRVTRINVDDVYYFIADHKYVTVRHPGGEALLEESLKQLEAEFTPRFVRIHRNALVARHLLVGMERTGGGGYCAILVGVETRLDISRRHVPEIRKLLNEG